MSAPIVRPWTAETPASGFALAVRQGLAAAPKTLSPKWLYDGLGVKLFEAITELPEYYPTRTEIALLAAHVSEMAGDISPGAIVVELGAGSSTKTPLLLAALERPALYAPLDISADYLAQSSAAIGKAFPGLGVAPIEADFTAAWALPTRIARAPGPRLGFFPGSTIGNLAPAAAVTLLKRARIALGTGARFILGVDTPKDEATLVAAYDDALGVTAAFNLNLLVRMNRELGARIDVRKFVHEARWNADESRIEMHLVSTATQTIGVGGRAFRFAAGETIHTESSYKHAPESVRGLAEAAGWQVEAQWLAPGDAFGVYRLAAR